MKDFERLFLVSILGADIAFLLSFSSLVPLENFFLRVSAICLTTSLVFGVLAYIFDARVEFLGENKVFTKEKNNILLERYVDICAAGGVGGVLIYLGYLMPTLLGWAIILGVGIWFVYARHTPRGITNPNPNLPDNDQSP